MARTNFWNRIKTPGGREQESKSFITLPKHAKSQGVVRDRHTTATHAHHKERRGERFRIEIEIGNGSKEAVATFLATIS